MEGLSHLNTTMTNNTFYYMKTQETDISFT